MKLCRIATLGFVGLLSASPRIGMAGSAHESTASEQLRVWAGGLSVAQDARPMPEPIGRVVAAAPTAPAVGCSDATERDYAKALFEYRAASLTARMELRGKVEEAQNRRIRCLLNILTAAQTIRADDIKEMERIKASIDEAARLGIKFKEETGAEASQLPSRPQLAERLSKRTRREIIDYLEKTGHPQKDQLIRILAAP